MGGLYDILAAYRQQNEPRFIYEGLYQDPDRFLDYDNSITDFTGQADYPFTGNIPTNARARYDARAYNTDEPLPSPYGTKGGTFFKDFSPRVGQTPKVEAPNFMWMSPQFKDGLDNSMYGGDRRLVGSDGSVNYYTGDKFPEGHVDYPSQADGITNYEFDKQPYENPTYQMKQQVGMVPTGIMNIDTDVPAGRGRGTEMEGEYPAMVLPKQKQDIGKFAGIMQQTDIDDDQSDEVEQQNWFQKLMNNSLMAKAGGILNAIFRPKQSDRYRPATMGIGSYSPAALNQMNAMGGYYSRPAMDQRSRQNRIANMILRRDADQNYSEKNLANLQAQMSGQPSQAQFATPKAAARSPKVGVSGYTSGDVARESRRGHYG